MRNRADKPVRGSIRGGPAVRALRPLALACLLLTALAWSGCSVEKHYEVLSFFFDGVPDPNGPDLAGGPGNVRRVAPGAIPVSAHAAYLERRCTECHGETARFGFAAQGFANLDAAVCLDCHEDASRGYSYMHGPVAAEACLFCHHAHESPLTLLLKAPSPELCLGCHAIEMDALREDPVHADLERDCLDCHHGHGADAPGLLRPPPPVDEEAATSGPAAPAGAPEP